MKHTLEFKWTVSRGRDTYGYNICSLLVDGRKVSACNGGGYDMKGTALGDWVAKAYADRLMALKPEQMEEHKRWVPSEKPRRICRNMECDGINKMVEAALAKSEDASEAGYLPPDAEDCPYCGKPTRPNNRDGKHVSEGRYFYGLTYHDPNYDPGKAVIGEDCADRTFSGKSEGKTVEQAERDGDTVGLERYQAFYTASSKVPTERHTVPLIDGACGFSCVERIMAAIGLRLEYIPVRSSKLTVYRLHEATEEEKAA